MSDVPVADEGGFQWRPPVCITTSAGAGCGDCHPIPTPEGSPDLYWCKGTCAEAQARCPALQDTPVTSARSPYYNIWAIVILAILLGLFFLAIGLLFGSLIRWGGGKDKGGDKDKDVVTSGSVPGMARATAYQSPGSGPTTTNFTCYPDPPMAGPSSAGSYNQPSSSSPTCPTTSSSNTFVQIPTLNQGNGSDRRPGPMMGAFPSNTVHVPVVANSPPNPSVTSYPSNYPTSYNGPFASTVFPGYSPPEAAGQWIYVRQ
jgi:hypothetical protein